jgi:NAD+ synthase
MTKPLRILAVQHDFKVGDIRANADAILSYRQKHPDVDLIVHTECAISGYSPEDLVFSHGFVEACEQEARRIVAACADGGPALLFGGLSRPGGGRVRNSAWLVDGTDVVRIDKHQLPNYAVFDELRHFEAGDLPAPVLFRGRRLGILVCEDCWFPSGAWNLARSGAEAVIVINGSPYAQGKDAQRQKVVSERVADTRLPFLYVNQVGGQDEIVYDGASFAMDAGGRITGRLKAFSDDVAEFVLTGTGGGLAFLPVSEEVLSRSYPQQAEADWMALVLATSGYVRKNGFRSVLLGLSGGIDSAVTAAVAVDALGPDRVLGVMMPSRWTSRESIDQSEEAAALLGIRHVSMPIQAAVDAATAALTQAGFPPSGVAAENLQARERGRLLMAISNQAGSMVLSTGNKSENAVGYATLYGDMSGGYNVLGDVYKTNVYALARWRNANRPSGVMGPAGPVVPAATIERAPTAELAPGQRDDQSLPPYPVLDEVLRLMVDGWQSDSEIVAAGHDAALVARIRRMVDGSEYKRRQGAPKPRITSGLFGRDRRVPIVNGWRGA